jgi:hypothetical protein
LPGEEDGAGEAGGGGYDFADFALDKIDENGEEVPVTKK